MTSVATSELWSQSSCRPHDWHGMCSYLGSFPPNLVNRLINTFTQKDDLVIDTFSGRGTTLLESRVLQRQAIASDLNPLAIALTSAKNAVVTQESLFERIDELEKRYKLAIYLGEAQIQPDEIKIIYHPYTLAELCYLSRRLIGSDREEDKLLVGAVLGIMHGNIRKDGSSAYASISMPNTFSMSPAYVKKFILEHSLDKPYRNVFDLLRQKVQRLYKNRFQLGDAGIVLKADARNIGSHPDLAFAKGKTKLLLTSPPYLNVVNYALQNWIRLWFLREDIASVDVELSDNLSSSA